jgi:hypothetical protein
VAARERKGLAVALHSSGKLLAAEKLSLYPAFSYVHQILPFCSKLCRIQFPTTITFVMTVNNVQSQPLERVEIHPQSPALFL